MKYEYISCAKNLATRNKVRLNSSRSSMEQETDDLFYWIMSRLEDSVGNCQPAQRFHKVIVETSKPISDDDYVLLQDGKTSKYCSRYVKGTDFLFVMDTVIGIFNSIGKTEEYSYHAEYIRHNRSSGEHSIEFLMST